MQFILTQQERDTLVDRAELDKALDAVQALRLIVIPAGKCIHDDDGPEYCDFCPLSDVGGGYTPDGKPRDPTRPTRELSRLMCTLSRNYSK